MAKTEMIRARVEPELEVAKPKRFSRGSGYPPPRRSRSFLDRSPCITGYRSR